MSYILSPPSRSIIFTVVGSLVTCTHNFVRSVIITFMCAMPVMARTHSSNVLLLSADVTQDKKASQVEISYMEEMDNLKFAIKLSLVEV